MNAFRKLIAALGCLAVVALCGSDASAHYTVVEFSLPANSQDVHILSSYEAFDVDLFRRPSYEIYWNSHLYKYEVECEKTCLYVLIQWLDAETPFSFAFYADGMAYLHDVVGPDEPMVVITDWEQSQYAIHLKHGELKVVTSPLRPTER